MRAVLIAMIAALLPLPALAQSCPQPLASATRLVLVTAERPDSTTATVERYDRDTPTAAWRLSGGAASALIGHRGLGWAYAFRGFARRGEPVKVEGDKRTPAGFFKLGKNFGFGASDQPNYLRLAPGMVCVNDPRAPAYNTIAMRSEIGPNVHGENLRAIPDYARGLLIDYPTDRKARAGSCIFMHLRLAGKTGTSGCVALDEPQLQAVQDHAHGGAVIAILPRQALDRFKGCLP